MTQKPYVLFLLFFNPPTLHCTLFLQSVTFPTEHTYAGSLSLVTFFTLKSILSETKKAIIAFFELQLACYIFLHQLNFFFKQWVLF